MVFQWHRNHYQMHWRTYMGKVRVNREVDCLTQPVWDHNYQVSNPKSKFFPNFLIRKPSIVMNLLSKSLTFWISNWNYLVAIIEACAFIAACMYTLYILSCISMVRLIWTMIKTGPCHVASYSSANINSQVYLFCQFYFLKKTLIVSIEKQIGVWKKGLKYA